MPKLHLKRTPQEDADRRAHKRRKRESKCARRSPKASSIHNDSADRKWDSSDSDAEYGNPNPPQPAAGSSSDSRYKPDYDAIRAELEEARFREKMADAFADDDGLDSLEARMNDYAHVPERWRTGSGQRTGAYYDRASDDDIFNLDPRHMDDEEYAEWIRAGMYRKTHAQEYAEEQERKALRDARRAQEKALKAENARLAKLAEAERTREILKKQARRLEYARENYHLRWKTILSTPDRGQNLLSFIDIPWPVLSAYRQKGSSSNKRDRGPALTLEDFTVDAIATFLVPTLGSGNEETDRRHRKDKIRETYLRFHPDKFEGRLMNQVRETDRQDVREAIGVVVRALNTLMGD
ncbi:hypothetical protein GGX14DRAFT_521276 [Mycena pura]|uniref:Uncharacterized protein n=1 Tax=Mycena pura TaxID=153505 RepID=A0AAD6VKQ4_9AGAR|nr:hypothetical protein GGX14DRAFT_521276 [Mycena pura]